MPSENVETSSPDRRTRKRAARRDALLDLAAQVVDRDGVDGLTMAALAEAADYAPASLYTYFPSRSSLLAALQQRALHTLAAVARGHLAVWDAALTGSVPSTAAVAELLAFSRLFLSAPEHHPSEFRLQQQLLVTPGAEDTQDAASVVPAAMVVLDVPRRLIEIAVDTGALDAGRPQPDPVGRLLEPSVLRTFAWVAGLNGALMVDSLSTGLPATGATLGAELTRSLLLGWGARPDELDDAAALAADLPVGGIDLLTTEETR